MSALHIRIGRGASRLPADLALSAIPSLPRPVLERLAQQIIDRLDDMDVPDEDREDDDPAGMMDEDELTTGPGVMAIHGVTYDGPGCPIADPGEYAPGDGPNLPPPCYDGEDQGVIILPAPMGIEPTRWRIS